MLMANSFCLGGCTLLGSEEGASRVSLLARTRRVIKSDRLTHFPQTACRRTEAMVIDSILLIRFSPMAEQDGCLNFKDSRTKTFGRRNGLIRCDFSALRN